MTTQLRARCKEDPDYDLVVESTGEICINDSTDDDSYIVTLTADTAQEIASFLNFHANAGNIK